MIQLTINFDPNTGACEISGIPMDAQQVPVKWICYAALRVAEKTIDAFDPANQQKATSQILLARGGLPPDNGRK